MSITITRPAARVRQGGLTLYTTSFKVRDLLTDHFYDIERLDPENNNDKGYQRLLNRARAKRLSEYLLAGEESNDAFLPTSLFLATDKDVDFDESLNTITFSIADVCPFSVVDGQHRLEGLRLAAEKEASLMDFEVPVNIAVKLSKIAQMCHFLIVNTTQKSVDKSVEQRIYARLSDSLEIEDVPSLPNWIQRIVESEDDKKALLIVDYLNSQLQSPWHNKIEIANQEKLPSNTTTQKTIANAIKKYVLTANNPVVVRPMEQQQKIMSNYWRALANILDDGRPTVLFKFNGIELFMRFSMPFFNRLQNMGNFKVETMESLLSDVFDNLEGEYAGVGHPDWWVSGTGAASNVNRAAINQIMKELTRGLHKTDGTAEIEL